MLLLFAAAQLDAVEYHVAKHGKVGNPGSRDRPFLTIQSAADVAKAGDVITVHEWIYRERVDPRFGGINDQMRIIYRAAEN